MKNIFAAISALFTSVLCAMMPVSAVGATPLTGDKDWIIYVVLAVVAIAMIVVIAVTGKKKR